MAKESHLRVLCSSVSDEKVVLLLGDLKKDTGCRLTLSDPTLVSRKEHVFGMKKLLTRVKFNEKGRLHEISVECKLSSAQSSRSINHSNSVDGVECKIRIDGRHSCESSSMVV